MIPGVVLVQVPRKHSMRRLLVSLLLKIRPRVSSRQLRARDSHPNLQTCSLKLTHPNGGGDPSSSWLASSSEAVETLQLSPATHLSPAEFAY